MSDFPFKEYKLSNMLIREFSRDVDSNELVWHQDQEDREIVIIEGTGWKLQMDNDIPRDMIPGEKYIIPKFTFHRIWKGETDLVLEIIKNV
jgi:hypothetical protein